MVLRQAALAMSAWAGFVHELKRLVARATSVVVRLQRGGLTVATPSHTSRARDVPMFAQTNVSGVLPQCFQPVAVFSFVRRR